MKVLFQVKPRLLRLLGEQLIRDAGLAVFELVKNAYDADATECKVRLFDIESPTSARVVVKDDGAGMTADTIRNVWMVIATDFRAKQREQGERTPRFHRFPLGEKGLGRLAAHKLGRKIEIVSRQPGKPEVVLDINWNKLESASDLRKAGVIVRTRKSDGGSQHVKRQMKVEKIAELTDEQLLAIRAQFEIEMRRRRLAFSVGDVGERLVIEHFRKTPGLPKLDRSSRGTKNVDANSRHGERYSIKTVCSAKKTGTIYPDSQDRDKQLFEYLLIVKLATDWSLESIHQLPWSEFTKVRSWDKRMNAWYVGISARALGATTLIYRAPGKNA